MHRAELVDFDQLVVEAIALLLENHRTFAFELHRQRHGGHYRSKHNDGEQRQNAIHRLFLEQTPAFQGPVEDREQRQITEVRIGARVELQARGVAADADVDGQFPQVGQYGKQPRLGRQWYRHDDEINAMRARIIGQILDLADLMVGAN